jgi:hypothetical protein
MVAARWFGVYALDREPKARSLLPMPDVLEQRRQAREQHADARDHETTDRDLAREVVHGLRVRSLRRPGALLRCRARKANEVRASDC